MAVGSRETSSEATSGDAAMDGPIPLGTHDATEDRRVAVRATVGRLDRSELVDAGG